MKSLASSTNKQTKLQLPEEKTIFESDPKNYIYLFYGPPGVGKTWFCNELFPRVLFLSTDNGTRNQQALRIEVHSYEDLQDALNLLKSSKVKGNYDAICLDHISDICGFLEVEVCRKLEIESLGDAEWGKGWSFFRKAVQEMVQYLIRLDLCLMMISHEAIKTIRTRSIEREQTTPNLTKTVSDVLYPISNIIGYCYIRSTKTIDGRKDVRYLKTKPTEDIYSKDNTRRVKPETVELLNAQSFIGSFKNHATK